MPVSSDTAYSAGFRRVEYIERGVAATLRMTARLVGGVAAITSATVTIYDPGMTAVVSAAAATVTSGTATYALGSGVLTSYAYAEGWCIEWACVMPDGLTHTFRQAAALVRRKLYPVASDADLYRRVPSLDPRGTSPLTRHDTFQGLLDTAWEDIEEDLRRAGNRANLVTDASKLYVPHVLRTLHLIFADLAARGNPAHIEESRRYGAEYNSAMNATKLDYDTDETGAAATSRRAVVGPVWAMGR